MNTLIVGNATILDYNILKDYSDICENIICCDGGIRHLYKLNLIPNIIIGDLDSSDSKFINYYKNKNINFIKFDVEKDYTDMEICINYCIQNNFENLFILGGIGDRFDHTISNLHLLNICIKNNIHAYLIDELNIIYLINKSFNLYSFEKNLISIMPFSSDVFITSTSGFYYNLNNETMKFGHSRGVSNYFVDTNANIILKNGTIIIIETFSSYLEHSKIINKLQLRYFFT